MIEHNSFRARCKALISREGSEWRAGRMSSSMDELTAAILADVGRLPSFRDSYSTLRSFATGFYHAVSWDREPWLWLVLSLLSLSLLAGVLGGPRARQAVFIATTAAVASLEPLNSLARRHWRSFATQNYFDERGVFVGVVVAAPAVFTAFVMLVLMLRDAAELVVKVKRMELDVKRRQQLARESTPKKDQ